MTLPPAIRYVQQQWWFSILVVPALIAAGPAFFECAGNDFAKLSLNCFKVGGMAAIAYIIAALQHSPGSASFKPDGTPNEAVNKVVEANKAGETVVVTTRPPTEKVVQPSVEAKP